VTRFIDEARAQQPKFNYQRNTVYLRFCHCDYRAPRWPNCLPVGVPREQIFAAGDHHNDV
jgi:hypothetical protein